jgi:predicted nucleic acid-binding protein
VIVYVETNFLLELAYLQERRESCDLILEMAKAGEITLALPAFSAAEARATWRHRASQRKDFYSELQRHIREISRSETLRKLNDHWKDVVAALVTGPEESRERMEIAIETIGQHGEIISLDREIVSVARWFEGAYSLTPQDALVLQSVSWHAQRNPGAKCFVTKDARGFATPAIYDELSTVNCKVLVNFADAVGYIRKTTQPPT